MVERILSQQQPLCATLLELHKGDMMLSDAEFSTLEVNIRICKSDETIGDYYRGYWCRKVGHYFNSLIGDTQAS